MKMIVIENPCIIYIMMYLVLKL